MGRITRRVLAVGFTLLVGSVAVAAQENAVGAGRVEFAEFSGGGGVSAGLFATF